MSRLRIVTAWPWELGYTPPPVPDGCVLLTDEQGAYLTDEWGAFLMDCGDGPEPVEGE